MSHKSLIIVAILVIFGIAIGAYAINPTVSRAPGNFSNATSSESSFGEPVPAYINDLITVHLPRLNSKISSPLTISGQARGSWYFEASAPVTLKNASGIVIASGHVTAQGDWITADFVPFTATLTFTAQPANSIGTLILKNDNPSGDPTKDKTLVIPVTF